MPVPELERTGPARRRTAVVASTHQPQTSWRPSIAGRALKSRVTSPLKLLALAVLIMVADWLFTHYTGSVLSMGPVRPLWVAGPMAVFALGVVIYAVVTSD